MRNEHSTSEIDLMIGKSLYSINTDGMKCMNLNNNILLFNKNSSLSLQQVAEQSTEVINEIISLEPKQITEEQFIEANTELAEVIQEAEMIQQAMCIAIQSRESIKDDTLSLIELQDLEVAKGVHNRLIELLDVTNYEYYCQASMKQSTTDMLLRIADMKEVITESKRLLDTMKIGG